MSRKKDCVGLSLHKQIRSAHTNSFFSDFGSKISSESGAQGAFWKNFFVVMSQMGSLTICTHDDEAVMQHSQQRLSAKPLYNEKVASLR